MSWWKKDKPYMALDMGQRSIKGVSLKKEKGRVQLTNAFLHDFSVSNTEYPNNNDVIKNLKIISEIESIKNFDAIVNLAGGSLHSFDMQLPLMPKKDLDEVVKAEVEKNISYPIEKAIFDYLIIEQTEDEEHPLLKIKAFVTKKNKVDALVKIVTTADLIPTIIDSDQEALIRVLKFNDYLKPDHLHVVVDLAETHTTVTLLHGTKLLALNQLDVSMGLINYRLQQKFSESYSAAEEVKEKITLKNASAETDPAVMLANETYVEILSKIQESIDYLRDFHFKKWPVAAFYFIGGGASVPELCEVFEDHYKIPCFIPNPFKNIDITEKSADLNKSVVFAKPYLMPLAVGLALRKVA